MAKIKLITLKDGSFQCPECAYTHTEQGSVRLHYYGKHGEGLKKRKQKNLSSSACEHQWRLLSLTQRNEAQAIENGYGKVCELCNELE